MALTSIWDILRVIIPSVGLLVYSFYFLPSAKERNASLPMKDLDVISDYPNESSKGVDTEIPTVRDGRPSPSYQDPGEDNDEIFDCVDVDKNTKDLLDSEPVLHDDGLPSCPDIGEDNLNY